MSTPPDDNSHPKKTPIVMHKNHKVKISVCVYRWYRRWENHKIIFLGRKWREVWQFHVQCLQLFPRSPVHLECPLSIWVSYKRCQRMQNCFWRKEVRGHLHCSLLFRGLYCWRLVELFIKPVFIFLITLIQIKKLYI